MAGGAAVCAILVEQFMLCARIMGRDEWLMTGYRTANTG